MKLGYLKDTGDAERMALQKEAVERAGAKKLFVDRAETPKAIRPHLRRLKQEMAEGDTVIIQSLPCLGRNIRDLLDQLEALREKGVALVSLEEGIDTSTEAGAAVLPILNSLLHFDRNMSNFWNPETPARENKTILDG
ncbi:MAG: recombinase family protein [Oscillibacter sp.]|nr:recombinase family protein [Oscillibacter sp.]